jgi:AraC family transcriptional regulator
LAEMLDSTPNSGFDGVRGWPASRIAGELAECGRYRDPAGSEDKRHVHPYWEFGYVVEGTTELRTGNGPEACLQSGSFWSVAPEADHWFRRGPESGHLRLVVGYDLSAMAARHSEWNLLQVFSDVMVLHQVYHIESLFLRALNECSRSVSYRTEALRLALDTLILQVLRANLDRTRKGAHTTLHPAVSRALHLLQNRYRENWTIARLATEAGISRARLAQLFRSQIGTPIHRILNRVRIEHALTLLKESDLSVSEIAYECGFSTSPHFARVFRQITGMRAVDYRLISVVSIEENTSRTPSRICSRN